MVLGELNKQEKIALEKETEAVEIEDLSKYEAMVLEAIEETGEDS